MKDETTTPPDSEDIPVEVAGGEEPKEAAPAPTAPTSDDRLAAVEKEKKELHDRLLRTAADFDNYRKRARKDMDEARAKAKEDVLREVLPVIDNLERAVASVAPDAGAAATGILEGVKLVLRQFQNALERFEVRGFTAVGEPFDPARHEAIAQVETAEAPPGTVFTEMQKGYTMGARLLRPALVTVAKAPPAPAPTPTPEPPAAQADPKDQEPG